MLIAGCAETRAAGTLHTREAPHLLLSILNLARTAAAWLLLLQLVRGVGAELAGGLRLCRDMSCRMSSVWSEAKQHMAISTSRRRHHTVHPNETTAGPRRMSKHGRNDPFCAHSALKELD